MPTTKQLLNQFQHQLTNRVERPDLEALDLLAVALHRPVTNLLAAPEMVVNDVVVGKAEELMARRINGEPLAYLIGSQQFCGRQLLVTPATLIPRPATEVIVNQLLSSTSNQSLRVADIGTGCGAIAITLVLARPTWQVIGIDKSPQAIEVAIKNGVRYQANVDWRLGSLAQPLTNQTIDIIIANLPYVPTALSRADGLSFEPALALDGGPDGLEIISALIRDLPQPPRQSLWLECLPEQAEPITKLILNHWPATTVQPVINDQSIVIGVCAKFIDR